MMSWKIRRGQYIDNIKEWTKASLEENARTGLSVKTKKFYFVMVTMSRLNRDFEWAIRDKQSLVFTPINETCLVRESNHRPAACQTDVLTTTLPLLSINIAAWRRRLTFRSK